MVLVSLRQGTRHATCGLWTVIRPVGCGLVGLDTKYQLGTKIVLHSLVWIPAEKFFFLLFSI